MTDLQHRSQRLVTPSSNEKMDGISPLLCSPEEESDKSGITQLGLKPSKTQARQNQYLYMSYKNPYVLGAIGDGYE